MIKNIIFDVGDVLIEYRWKDMLVDYGMEKDYAIHFGNTIFEDELWHELDLSVLSREEIISRYKKKYPSWGKDIEWFITHGEYMHVQRNDVYEIIHKLKLKGYKIYLLSNYSKELFLKHTKGASFLDDIDGKVVSYEVKLVKPDKRIYETLINKYSLLKEECLFLDDRQENIIAAENLGIQGFFVKSKEELINKLNCLL